MSFQLKKPSAIFKHLNSFAERNEFEQNALKLKTSEDSQNTARSELIAFFFIVNFFYLFSKLNQNQLIVIIDI
jgi:hypothetical protein